MSKDGIFLWPEQRAAFDKLVAERDALQAIVDKWQAAWREANEYALPPADGSRTHRAARRVLDCFAKAAEAAKAEGVTR